MRSSLLLALALASCGGPGTVPELVDLDEAEADEAQEREAEEAPEPDAEEAPAAADEEPIRRSRPLMGTVFQISTLGVPEPRAEILIAQAFDEIARLEAILSEWQATSEVTAINDAAGEDDPVEVGEDTFRVVRAGLDVSRWSDGAFDLTWAALRGLYLFRRGEERVPSRREVRERLRRVGWARLEVDADGRRVRLRDADMAIGTGGIAKGYALDRAAQVLRDGGAESFMLFGGGQVQVHGLRGDRPWRVGIQHPRDESSYIGFLEATEGSISTSGDYEHAFVDDEGRHWHHIIDLSTGLPARRSMQVTMLAPEGLYADALSTACFIRGPESCLEMLAEVPGSPEAVIVGPDLRVWTTPGTEEKIVWRVERDERGRLPGDPRYR